MVLRELTKCDTSSSAHSAKSKSFKDDDGCYGKTAPKLPSANHVPVGVRKPSSASTSSSPDEVEKEAGKEAA